MEKNEEPPSDLRWSIARRLEFIESRLIWEGHINRADIAERFKVQVQQASADLGLYEQLAPKNITYDRLAKTFVPAPTFEPRYTRPVADRQLLQLAAIGAGLVNPAETWFDELPPLGVVPVPQRSVPTMIMRWILEAIRSTSAIEIHYQSINRPDPIRRTIVPHALGYDGERWHARAWCPKNRAFHDFVLSRIAEVGSLTPSKIDPAADREWNEEVAFVLAPNPALSDGSRRSLAKEYNMQRGRLRISVRVALAYYMICRHDLDLEGLEPGRQQLVLINADEVQAARAQTLAATQALIEAGKHERDGPESKSGEGTGAGADRR